MFDIISDLKMVVQAVGDLHEMVTRLEQQELDCQTGSGTLSVSVYCELLACYLAMDPPNLTQAKYLMQRVPATVKQGEEGAELVKLCGRGCGPGTILQFMQLWLVLGHLGWNTSWPSWAKASGTGRGSWWGRPTALSRYQI